MRHRLSVGGSIGQLWAILWSLLCVVPFVLIIMLAFKSNKDIFAKPLSILNVEWHPSNFSDAWNGAPGGQGFPTYLINTVVVAVIAIALAVILGAITAYFSAIASPRVRTTIIRCFLVAITMPLIMLLIPYYTAFDVLNLLSKPWALGVVYAALCLPTCVLILHPFYLGFPKELREAAAIDGIGDFRTFLQVALPLSKGPITAVGMINGFWVWGETQLAIVLLQDPESRTIPVGILDFQGQFTANTGAMFAGLTLATIPLIVVYLVFNRSITKGVALGGVSR